MEHRETTPTRTRTRDRTRIRLLSLLAEVLVFLGLALIGYAAWTLWGTGQHTADAQHTYREALRDAWQQAPTQTPAAPGPTPSKVENDPLAKGNLGKAIALIRVPALGADWEWAIVEGTDRDTLTEGIGHEPGTASPGQVGNFVLAGHRAGHGAPFDHLPDNVDIGARVEVETRDAIHIYRITKTKHTSPYDAAVLEPVPDHPSDKPTKAAITLITCTPRFGSTGRWIAIGKLTATVPKPTPNATAPDPDQRASAGNGQ